MRHHGFRDDDDAQPGQVRPAAEVEVVAGVRQGRVRTTEPVPDIAADQHSGGADREHVTALVELALVDVVDVYPRHPGPEPGGGESDVEQPAAVVPTDLLAAGDSDRRAGIHG